MNNRTPPAAEQPWNGPGMREFIAMMAALMATNALATDAMLPALGAMGTALHVQEANQRQLVITCFLLGIQPSIRQYQNSIILGSLLSPFSYRAKSTPIDRK